MKEMRIKMKVVSLFAGIGGLDSGLFKMDMKSYGQMILINMLYKHTKQIMIIQLF